MDRLFSPLQTSNSYRCISSRCSDDIDQKQTSNPLKSDND